jgi:hypothetical protein
MSYLPAVERELMAAIDRAQQPQAVPAPGGSRRRSRRRSRRTGLAVAFAVLALGGVAGAVAVLPTGDPAGAPSPDATPGSEQLAGVNVPDPDGGPPWDVEFFTKRGGQQCAQVGRSAEGRFGVLGADGALHPLPPGGGLWACGGDPGASLDAGGFIATGAAGATDVRSPCEIQANRPCDETASRVFLYGVLGSRARSLTLTEPGESAVALPLGRHGTFLVVRSGRGPIRGTLTATWDDGHTTSGSAMLGSDGLTPFLARPDQPE